MEQIPVQQYFGMLGGVYDKFDRETIRRVTQFCEELKQKREYTKFTVFDSDSDEMIIANHLRLFSVCEHHLLPFYGQVSIGYIPQGKIFGLSKFQRIVDKFASKPQIQENLTKEIADFIDKEVNPIGLGILVKSVHTCVFARGVQSANAEFITNEMRGVFREPQVKNEFLSCVYSTFK
jgi:GTP cyclohydrolase I